MVLIRRTKERQEVNKTKQWQRSCPWACSRALISLTVQTQHLYPTVYIWHLAPASHRLWAPHSPPSRQRGVLKTTVAPSCRNQGTEGQEKGKREYWYYPDILSGLSRSEHQLGAGEHSQHGGAVSAHQSESVIYLSLHTHKRMHALVLCVCVCARAYIYTYTYIYT